jgi:class 3 adenylate cyclase/tetratricopeptide (TPR) repeat protein
MIEQDAAPTRLLRPYLPRLLLQWAVESPDSRWREVEGSIVFVDISGFTKMSERLARQGKAGAEEVTDVLGPVFARLLAVAYGNGGGLIKFGGDALLLLFTGPDHAGQAARSAFGMRRELREIGPIPTSAGAITLRMSVGVNSGTFHMFLVGESHRELVLTGPAATETVTMESTATAGEILISPSTAAAIPADAVGRAKGPGFLLRRSPGIGVQAPTLDDGLVDDDLIGYLPTAIRNHVMAGGDDPVHRPVTVAFVHFDEIDSMIREEGPGVVAERLEHLVAAAQLAADEHGVTFLGTDIDKDGGKVILVAGTPQALGDDEERMLLTLRSIMISKPEIPVRIGVNRGPVFAGDIGPSYRRTYTVMGDAVNLAARVMAKAVPGQLLSTGQVLDASPIEFETEPLEPFMVKGKRLPVQAYAVGAIIGARRHDDELPLVGRDNELDVLSAAVDAAWEGGSALIEIVGEPGIGKTRLMTEARRLGGALPQLRSACELYTISQPYGVIGELVSQAIGCEPGESAEQRSMRLQQAVRESAPNLEPWLPLLAVPLDVTVPMTAEVADLEEEYRRVHLAESTAELLAARVSPGLISIEDVHWMDEASAEVMGRIAQEAPRARWVICVSRRDDGTGYLPAGGVTTLRPERLSSEQAEQLIGAATSDQPLLPHARTALAERSGGNPLFLRELLRSAGEDLAELPDTIEAMAMAEIDRLPPPDRRLLRLASVLGMSFTDELVAEVLGDEAPPDAGAWRRLSAFLTAEGRQRRFRHALVRDAAYEGLPFRRRREMHARAGEALERLPDADEHSSLLALHFGHAQRYDLSWRYGRAAADRARLRYANTEAAKLLWDAVDAAARSGNVTPTSLADAFETLGELEDRIGRYDRAMRAFKQAQRLVQDDPVKEAALLLRKAWVREREGRFTQSLRWINRGLAAVAKGDGEEAARVRSRLLSARATIRQTQGRYSDALAFSTEAIAAAEAAGDLSTVAEAHLILGWANSELGLGGESHARQALAIAEKIDDLQLQGLALNNLGTIIYYEGRWTEAGELWERSETIRLRTGDAVNAAMATNNIGEILSDQGHLAEADERFRRALDVWRAARFDQLVPAAIGNLGRAAARGGRPDEALELLQQALEMATANQFTFMMVETEARIAEAHLFAGDPDAAIRTAEQVLARPADETVLQRPLLRRVMAYALMQLGRTDQAQGLLELSMDESRRVGLVFEEAQSMAALLDLALLEDRPPNPMVADACVTLLERLGVIRLPPVPLVERAPVALTG